MTASLHRLAGALFVLALSFPACAPALDDDEPLTILQSNGDPADRSCTPDDECVKVPAACCSCSEGGELTAVRADARAGIAESCAGAICAQVISQHATCRFESSARCIDGVCELVVVSPP